MTRKTITGLYDSYEDAATTVREIEAAGVPHNDISLVANNIDSRYVETADTAPSGAGTGATIGTVLGGGAGLLAGLGLLAIPGVGPVVAAGWLVSTAVGAVAGATAGAATGGIVDALTDSGVSEEHAHVYAEGVRRGGTLVTARVDEEFVPAVEAVMGRHGSVDPDSRAVAYRERGWSTFDDRAAPYSPEEIEAERALYPRGPSPRSRDPLDRDLRDPRNTAL